MSKELDERYTPESIWRPVSELVDGFDLDPCAGPMTTIAAANLRNNGLDADWNGDVFLNPPGSLKIRFAEKLQWEIEAGRVRRFAWIAFQWDHTTRWWEIVEEVSTAAVLFRKRQKFLGPDGRLYEVGRSQALMTSGIFTSALAEAYPHDKVITL